MIKASTIANDITGGFSIKSLNNNPVNNYIK